jgi:hypothetical protein
VADNAADDFHDAERQANHHRPQASANAGRRRPMEFGLRGGGSVGKLRHVSSNRGNECLLMSQGRLVLNDFVVFSVGKYPLIISRKGAKAQSGRNKQPQDNHGP